MKDLNGNAKFRGNLLGLVSTAGLSWRAIAERTCKMDRKDLDFLREHHVHSERAGQASGEEGDRLFHHEEEVSRCPKLEVKTSHSRHIFIFFFQFARGFPLQTVPLMNQQN